MKAGGEEDVRITPTVKNLTEQQSIQSQERPPQTGFYPLSFI